MSRTGLILEGGGTRGVFTAGVLDYFMEQDLYLPYVIGVSAGACNAVNYVARQPGRTKKCTIDYLAAGSYVGVRYLIRNHSLFNMDLIFDAFPNAIFQTARRERPPICKSGRAKSGLCRSAVPRQACPLCPLWSAWTACLCWTVAWEIPFPSKRPCGMG